VKISIKGTQNKYSRVLFNYCAVIAADFLDTIQFLEPNIFSP